MYKLSISLFLLIGALTNCANETKQLPPVTPVVGSGVFKKSSGDCTKFCADINASYPVIQTGTDALKAAVQDWAEANVTAISSQTEDTIPQKLSMEQAGAAFIENWKSSGSELHYSLETRDTVLMANTKFVVLRMDVYCYTGGAHPNYFTQLAVFDAVTGKIIPESAYITNKEAILPLLDIAYQGEKKEAFEAGNAYMDGKILFPTQCAFTEKGVLFHYDTYEIAPYAMGDADIFMTWTDLGNSAKNPLTQVQ